MAESTGATIVTADGAMISFSLVSPESIVAAYIHDMERAEYVRSVAAGEPASSVAMRFVRRSRSSL